MAFSRVRFVSNAKEILTRAWSVRLSLLAALLSTVETGYTYWATGKAPVVVIGAAVVSISAAVARIVAQENLSDRP